MNYIQGDHYLVQQDGMVAIAGPMRSQQVIDIINALPFEEAVKYCNESRYALAKNRYPRNKAGNTSLTTDIALNGELYADILMRGNKK